MQDLCPLCLKNGVKKKIKLLQINLQEGVWVCEEEKCVWPLGYEDFVLYPRVVGKIWSCYWNDYKPVATGTKDNVNMIIKSVPPDPILSFDNNTLKEFIASEHTDRSNNFSYKCTDLNKSQTDIKSSNLYVSNQSKITSHDNNENLCKSSSFFSNDNNSDKKSLKNNCLQSIDDHINGVQSKSTCINSLNACINEKDNIQHLRRIDVSRGTPKITSIEKTNINITGVKMTNQVPLLQEIEGKVVSGNRSTGLKECILPLKYEKPSSSEGISNDKNLKPNLHVTTAGVGDLTSTRLSLEIPVQITSTDTIIPDVRCANIGNNMKQNVFEMKNAVVKRNITSGKQYEKFSFSAIKKKVETTHISDKSKSNSSDTEITAKRETVQNIKTKNTRGVNPCENNSNLSTINFIDNYKQTISDRDNACALSELNNSMISSLSQETAPSDTLTVNSNVNLDTVLEDFLMNDYNISEDINDEWLNSLLS